MATRLELKDGRTLISHKCGMMKFEYFENSTDKCQVKNLYRYTSASGGGNYMVITGDNAATCIARFAMTPENERAQLLADYMIRAKRRTKGFWEPINGRK